MSIVIRLTTLQLESLRRARRLDNLLTPAERRVTKIATLGHTIKEIADLLGNSPKTIGRHIESITIKARRVYGETTSFRSSIVPELRCYYFLTEAQDTIDRQN
jgi:DNA-binding CsgD family transcriptional regulator